MQTADATTTMDVDAITDAAVVTIAVETASHPVSGSSYFLSSAADAEMDSDEETDVAAVTTAVCGSFCFLSSVVEIHSADVVVDAK